MSIYCYVTVLIFDAALSVNFLQKYDVQQGVCYPPNRVFLENSEYFYDIVNEEIMALCADFQR